jgi:hypothetical protein
VREKCATPEKDVHAKNLTDINFFNLVGAVSLFLAVPLSAMLSRA